MYKTQKLTRTHFAFKSETMGMLFDIERDILTLDRQVKYSPFLPAIQKTLFRGDALSSANAKNLRPEVYSTMRVEAAGSLLSSAGQDYNTLRKLLFDETHIALDESIEVYRFMEASMHLSDFKNIGSVITPDNLAKFLMLCNNTSALTPSQNEVSPSSYLSSNVISNSTPGSKIPEEYRESVQNLCCFINSNALCPLAQAAIVQNQLESIDLFKEDIEKLSRLVTNYIFYRRGLLNNIIFPLNLFATRKGDGYRNPIGIIDLINNNIDSSALAEELILDTIEEAKSITSFTLSLHKVLSTLAERWRQSLPKVERGSAVELLLYRFVGTPIMTTAQASKAINKSFSTACEALTRLESAGIIKAGMPIKRNKTFEASEAINIHNAIYEKYERRRASLQNRISEPYSREPARSAAAAVRAS